MTSIRTLYKQYIEVFPQEADALRPLGNQLKRGEADITDRKNFEQGHVTVGSIVVSLPSRRVFLIDHAVLRKQIQPGGHIKPDDATILDTAYRECKEEAGISVDHLRYIALSEQSPELPIAINLEHIAPNSAKDEPAHLHYDFWYLFTVSDGTPTQSTGYGGASNPQWTSFSAFAENAEFSRQAEKIAKLLATS